MPRVPRMVERSATLAFVAGWFDRGVRLWEQSQRSLRVSYRHINELFHLNCIYILPSRRGQVEAGHITPLIIYLIFLLRTIFFWIAFVVEIPSFNGKNSILLWTSKPCPTTGTPGNRFPWSKYPAQLLWLERMVFPSSTWSTKSSPAKFCSLSFGNDGLAAQGLPVFKATINILNPFPKAFVWNKYFTCPARSRRWIEESHEWGWQKYAVTQ